MDPVLRETNRRNWNERARIHAASRFYDLDGFADGTRRLWLHPREPDELGDVTGRSLCQLQCHLGVETLSWARLGAARVVGLDFAEAAITSARDLAARCGLADRATFVLADVHDGVAALADHAPFDIVYASVGALCWLPSIARWADVVAGLLGPGGVVYLREVHPMFNTVVERDGALVIEAPYFERAEPFRWDQATTYTDGDARLEHTTTYDWAHGLGAIVSALLERGFVLELLREHHDGEWQGLPMMVREDDGWYRLPPAQRDLLPITFSLRARRR